MRYIFSGHVGNGNICAGQPALFNPHRHIVLRVLFLEMCLLILVINILIVGNASLLGLHSVECSLEGSNRIPHFETSHRRMCLNRGYLYYAKFGQNRFYEYPSIVG